VTRAVDVAPLCGRYQQAASLICKRWSVSLVAVLTERPSARFNELSQAVPGITPKLLAERLRELEAAGIVERRLVNGQAPRVSYTLTAKGEALRDVVNALQLWADSWVR
jgi:DNA-binding HxlR family transcriptional regulator